MALEQDGSIFDNKIKSGQITNIDDFGRLKHDEIVFPSEIEPELFGRMATYYLPGLHW